MQFPYTTVPGTANIKVNFSSPLRERISFKDYGQITTYGPAAHRYNRAVREGYVMLYTGDEPYAAICVTHPEHTDNPSFHIGGHLEIENNANLKDVTFMPASTRWEWEDGLCLEAHLTAFGFAAAVTSSRSRRLKLKFGQMQLVREHFRSAYLLPEEGLQETNVQIGEDGAARFTCAQPGTEMYEVFAFKAYNGQTLYGDGAYACADLEMKAGETCLFCAACLETGDLPRNENECRKAMRTVSEKYRKILEDCRVKTPDELTDAAFRAAVLGLSYGHVGEAWYEGCHYWNTYFTNNYQISAAVALGYYEQARRALVFFASHPEGYGPIWSDGSQQAPQRQPGTNCVPMHYEGAPYYIYQLYEYIEATGDISIFGEVRQWLFDMLDCFEQVQYRDGFWGFPMGCNPFLYQADNLALPYASSSVTLFMAGAYEKLSDLCARCGYPSEAERFAAKSRRSMTQGLRLWDERRKCFVSHMDFQYKRHFSHYYTDFVFPVLYTNLPSSYTDGPLAQLRRQLIRTGAYGQTLMQVGILKPEGFGNDNIMPVQMAETAGAMLEACDSETGIRLFEGTALSATVYTEAPGNFPERLNDEGKGEGDYLFGNPAAVYAYRYIHSLFGLSVTGGGKNLSVRPCFPEAWNDASLELPCAGLAYEKRGGKRIYILTPKRAFEKANFALGVPNFDSADVTVNGQRADVEILRREAGARIVFSASYAPEIRVEVVLLAEKAYMPRMAERVPQEELPHVLSLPKGARFENAVPLKLDELADDLMYARTAWRRSEDLDLRLELNGNVFSTPWCDFTVKPCPNNPAAANVRGVKDGHYPGTAISFRLVAMGSSRDEARSMRAFPEFRRIARIPVERKVSVVLPLMVTEAEVRLTGSRVGCVRLAYDDGTVEVTPLIHGRTFTPLVQPTADRLLSMPLAYAGGSLQDSISILPLKADAGKTLDYLELEIDTADAFLALAAVDVILK